jgi:hypothetical protein
MTGRAMTRINLTRIRLTRKFANSVNGVDLTNRRVGEIFDLRSDAASILISEGWAELWVEPSLAQPRDAKNRPPSDVSD